jgi:orotidine-5'-phosphate decarboxylase
MSTRPSSAPPSNVLNKLIVALDVSSASEARSMVTVLGDSVHFYKVGMQLYTAVGPDFVRELVQSGKEVFLDLKFHDIPNTVAAAVRAAGQLGASMLTVHAAGGGTMLRAAVEAAAELPRGGMGKLAAPQILAVTVLTSMNEDGLHETGVDVPVVEQVARLASVALNAGCQGLVSSAHEVKTLRAKFGRDFLTVTPGVRPKGSDHADQARVVTPTEAIAAGATHIVVGRPITAGSDPAAAARSIQQEIANAIKYQYPAGI